MGRAKAAWLKALNDLAEQRAKDDFDKFYASPGLIYRITKPRVVQQKKCVIPSRGVGV